MLYFYSRYLTLGLTLASILTSVTGCEPPETTRVVRPLEWERLNFFADMKDAIYSWDVRIRGNAELAGCSITLSSDVDGRVWSGRSDSDGEWVFRGELSPGLHQLTFQVRCEEGRSVTYTYEVNIRDNEQPECRIASPLDGQVYREGEPIAFIADNWDPDDDRLMQLWSSDVNGGLFEGEEWSMSLFTIGENVVTVDAYDDFGGHCSDTVSIWIK